MRGEVEGEIGLVLVRTERVENAGDVVVLVGAGHEDGLALVLREVELEKVGVHAHGGQNGSLRERVEQPRQGGVHAAVGLEVVLDISWMARGNAIAARAETLLSGAHVRVVVLLETQPLLVDVAESALCRCALARVRRGRASVVHAVEELLHGKRLLRMQTKE